MSLVHYKYAIAALMLPMLAAAPETGQSGAEEPDSPPAELVLEEPVEPFVPLRPRSEEDVNRIQAGAHYATGRTLFHRGDLAGALRHYQRAWRWDPSASDVLGDIVALAFSVNRPQMAVRYAVLSAEHGQSEALMLRRLALLVSEEGDWPRAAKLYRLWLAHPDTKLSRNNLDKVLVQLEIGRLQYLVDDPQAASVALADFQRRLLGAEAGSRLARRIRAALGDDLNATWELCAAAHLEAKQFDLAAEALEQIDLPLEEAGRLGYLKAQVALEQGDPLAAWEHLRSYFAAGVVEEGTHPYELLGRVLEKLNQGDTILLELAKLQQQHPHNPALAIALATQLEQDKQEPAAIELLRSVVSGGDGVPEELVADAAERLVQLYARRGNARELLDVLLMAADRLESLADLENIFQVISQHAGLIDRLSDLADEVDTSSGPRALAVAGLLLEAERYDAANEYFRAAVAADAERAAEFTLTWGLALFAADRFDAAATVFQQGLDDKILAANDPTFHYYLSMSLEMAGKTDEALPVARRAAELQSDSAEFAAHVPWILYHADRREEAIEAYEAVLARFDDERDSPTRDELRGVRSSLSHLATMVGDLEAGEEWLQQILDEFPEDIGANNDLGYLWADSGKHMSRAHAMIQAAVDAEPDNAAYHDSLGWVLFRLGDAEAAIRELEKAAELSRAESGDDSQADGVILDHLGDAHLAAGNITEAVRYWQLALGGLEKNEPQMAVATQKKIEQHAEE